MYLYMMVHPGKKLNFMGNEIGQLREWDEKREQDWEIRKYPVHDSFYQFMKELNHIYLAHPALSEWDYKDEGFQWLDCHQESRCIYAILRESKKEKLVAIFNFGNQPQDKYKVEIKDAEKIEILLHSDWKRFGGNTDENEKVITLKDDKLVCKLAPFSGIILEIRK